MGADFQRHYGVPVVILGGHNAALSRAADVEDPRQQEILEHFVGKAKCAGVPAETVERDGVRRDPAPAGLRVGQGLILHLDRLGLADRIDHGPKGCRIDAARRAQKDSGKDFIIIARCDELYTSEMGGGGSGSMEEAVKRGHAYMEAGADILFYPPRPDWVADVIKALGGNVPVATMGFTLPDTAFNMLTGGWVTACANHLKMARELMETGKITSGNYNFPEKYELIDHPLYDGLIEEWAEKTGRESRPNHAP